MFDLLQRKGLAARVTTDEDRGGGEHPPQTTRRSCAASSSPPPRQPAATSTVDWVHLKLYDQAQRMVLCKDPFRSVDERVEAAEDETKKSWWLTLPRDHHWDW